MIGRTFIGSITRPAFRKIIRPIIAASDAGFGPSVISTPYVSPMVAQEGTQVTRTQGSYSPRGGGSVNITTSEWRLDGAQVGTGATYTPSSGDVGGVLTYYEVATETGGTAAGITVREVILGAVQAIAAGATTLDDTSIFFDSNATTFDEAA